MTPTRNPIRRARLVAFAVLVVVFLAGGLAGAAFERISHHRDGRPRVHDGRSGRHHRGRPRLFSPEGAMGKRLNLTPEQRANIEEILRDDSASTDSLLRTMRPVLKAHFDSTAAAIRAVLTPEQRAEFERYRRERRREMVKDTRR